MSRLTGCTVARMRQRAIQLASRTHFQGQASLVEVPVRSSTAPSLAIRSSSSALGTARCPIGTGERCPAAGTRPRLLNGSSLAILHTVACGWRAQVAGTRGLRHRIQCNGEAITDYTGTRSRSMKAAATRPSSHIMVVCFKILSSRSSLSRFTSTGTCGGEGRDEGNSRRQWCSRRSCREMQVLCPAV